jgi:hypothetical protein
MRILLIIIAVHSVVIGFGFLLASWGLLVSPDHVAMEEQMLEWKVAREQGWRGQIGFALNNVRGWWPRPGVMSRNWENQPVIRKYLITGCSFLAIAVGAGHYLDVFN